jgi:Tfp pilus assembly protein PilF
MPWSPKQLEAGEQRVFPGSESAERQSLVTDEAGPRHRGPAIDAKFAVVDKGLPPQPIRMRLPGWGGAPDKRMENGSDPQPWHCRPFVDAATYGLELVYHYETECQVVNDNGQVRFEWDYANEPGVKLHGEEFGLFDTRPARFYSFQASVDVQAPPGYVVQTQPHPRFFTDESGTVAPALIGHVQTEWFPKPLFVVFKIPAPGQRHIFRKGEPYAQIIFVPRQMAYRPTPMTPEEGDFRRQLWDDMQTSASYIATNVWHEPDGGESKNYYKVLARAFERDGIDGVKETVRAAMDRRRAAIPEGKTINEYLDLAREYQRQGKHVEAKDLLISVILRNPDNAEAASRLGILAMSMDLPAFALYLMKQAVTLQPQSAAYHANLGEILRRMNRLSEAEAAMRKSLELNPTDPQVLSNLGTVVAAQGRADEGLHLCRLAIASGARLPVVHFRAGTLLAQLGQIEQARACFLAALEINPGYVPAQRQLQQCSSKAPLPHISVELH